jgi:putative tryptophan/tyrosine transport system substrate-binding protein
VIGFLSGASFETMHNYVTVFKQSLAETGFTEGRDVAIEYRWAEGHNDRLPELAADLVRRGVAVIVVGASTPGSLAAKAATQTIPIVFFIGTDPVKVGLVASLAHPDGNTARSASIRAVFSKAKNLPICRCSKLRRSNWPLTSRPPRRLA